MLGLIYRSHSLIRLLKNNERKSSEEREKLFLRQLVIR